MAVKCVASDKLLSNPLSFLQEAAIMHRINHAHIVRLFGVVLDTKEIMLVGGADVRRGLLTGGSSAIDSLPFSLGAWLFMHAGGIAH